MSEIKLVYLSGLFISALLHDPGVLLRSQALHRATTTIYYVFNPVIIPDFHVASFMF